MKPYPDYKNSDVELIGEIPQHWNTAKLKYLTKKVGSGVTPTGGSAVYINDGVALIRSQNVHFDGLRLDDVAYISEEIHDEMKASRVYPGDVLLNITGASIGRCCVVPKNLVEANVNQHVCVVRPNTQIKAEFLNAFLSSDKGQQQISLGERGISRQGLNFEQLNSFDVIVPPLNEQQIIVDYLDHKTAVLDTLIAQKQHLIELLQEERTAVIGTAVTQGLDSHALRKSSGIPWLGDIPTHWEVGKFKHAIDFQEGPGILAKDFREDGIPLLRIGNVQEEKVDLDGCNYLDEEQVAKQWNHFRLKERDLLISCSATTGIVSEIGENAVGAIPYTGLIRLRPAIENIDRYFIKWLVSANIFFVQIDLFKTGSTIQHFGPTHLNQMIITLPPLEEQVAIVEYIQQKTSQINHTIAQTEKQIALLKEYRSTLISRVVTGKIDVRQEVIP